MPSRTGAAFFLAVTVGALLFWGAQRDGDRLRLDTYADLQAAIPKAYRGVPSSIVFDSSTVQSYELTVSDADWEWLNANEVLEQYVPATLKFGGRVYEDVAVRYKGSYGALRFCFNPAGAQTCKKLSLKLKFNEYDSAGRFFGLRRLNLHAMEKDATKMHEMLGYEQFRQAGVPAPRTAYARVTVNGEFVGLFLAVEEIDEEFIQHAFPDAGKGTLFKDVWPEHLTVEPYTAAVEAGPAKNAEDMLRFAEALKAAPDDAFLDTLASWTDLDTLMNFLAVDRLIDNFDGIVGWYCPAGPCYNHNYFWYKEAFSDRVWLIPWDLDFSFNYPSPIRTFYRMPDWDAPQACNQVKVFLNIPGRPPSCDPLISRVAAFGREQYASASRELLAGQFSLERLHARIDELSQLVAESVAQDEHGPSVVEWEAAVRKLKVDIGPMRSYIEQKVSR